MHSVYYHYKSDYMEIYLKLLKCYWHAVLLILSFKFRLFITNNLLKKQEYLNSTNFSMLLCHPLCYYS